MSEGRDPFFIGWARPPAGLRGFLALCAVVLVAGFGAAGYLLAATASDPGGGAFRFDWGRQTVEGRLEALPYPVIHVTESARHPAGHTVLLSAQGKNGVQARGAPLDGQLVKASGVLLKRGDLDMLQVRGGVEGLGPVAGGEAPPLAVEALGRWRITGEICDGKCYAGAMRPGTGLAHKACANLCLLGGVPPVFVTTAPVAGERFLMLADAAGGPVTGRVLDHVATLVAIEGEVERRGSLLVFRIAPDSVRLAR